MKIIKEAYKLLISDGFKSIIIILQISIFILIFNISIGTLINANALKTNAQESGLSSSFYFSNITARQDLYKTINDELGGKYVPYSPSFFDGTIQNEYVRCNIFSDEHLKSGNIKLKNHKHLNVLNGNECIISSDLSSKYNIEPGDIIDFHSNNEKISLQVKGVMHSDEQLLKYSMAGSALTLKSVYEKPSNIIIVSNQAVPQGVNLIIQENRCGIVSIDSNLNEEEVKELYEPYGTVTSFEAMIKEEVKENSYITTFFFSFAIIIFLISVVSIGSNNFFTMQFNEKTLAVYFIYGMSWKSCAKIITLRNLLLVLYSGLLGIAFLSIATSSGSLNEISISGWVIFSSLFIVVSAIMLSNIPLYIKMMKTEPIKFFKEGW